MVEDKGGEGEGGVELDHQLKIEKEAVKMVGEEAAIVIGGEGEVKDRAGLDRQLETEKEAIKEVGKEAVTTIEGEGEEEEGGARCNRLPEIEVARGGRARVS